MPVLYTVFRLNFLILTLLYCTVDCKPAPPLAKNLPSSSSSHPIYSSGLFLSWCSLLAPSGFFWVASLLAPSPYFLLWPSSGRLLIDFLLWQLYWPITPLWPFNLHTALLTSRWPRGNSTGPLIPELLVCPLYWPLLYFLLWPLILAPYSSDFLL